MPITHVSMRAGRPAPFRTAVLKGIHESLHEALGVHPEAFFMSITEHEDANFLVNMTFPFKRSADLLLVQITLTAGRTADDKKRFYEHLVGKLQATLGVDPADVFINIIEVASENWSPGNGLAGRNAAIPAANSPNASAAS
ncbi:tautomerase family protein [Paraburkholderia acidiphila]|uniref:Tautomerase family protein n=1 Tax=Paraburkholderia acidiphila TaxID=2571747 RepID=A0A7Z2JC22_9BURK|nr:tautomerase family protein [Paraburkholderia acidiphila]QGZ57485.1 tautomerase family protein [Paraburkholderia acidiphila]